MMIIVSGRKEEKWKSKNKMGKVRVCVKLKSQILTCAIALIIIIINNNILNVDHYS